MNKHFFTPGIVNRFMLLGLSLLIISCKEDVFTAKVDEITQKNINLERTAYLDKGREYEEGIHVGLTINENKEILTVHGPIYKGNKELNIKSGLIDGSGSNWILSFARQYTTGTSPHIAMNNHGTFVETHVSMDYTRLFFNVGSFEDISIFNISNQIEYSRQNDNFKSDATQVAINDDNIVVSVTAEQDHKLLYRVGIADPETKGITFGDNTMFTTGKNPRIAINNKNQIVALWENRNEGELYCRFGTIETNNEEDIIKEIKWGAREYKYTIGRFPALTLLDDGTVIEDHTSHQFTGHGNSSTYSLCSTIGKINTTAEKVEFYTSTKYDTGLRTSIAAFPGSDNNINIISAHEKNNRTYASQKRLYYSVGILAGIK